MLPFNKKNKSKNKENVYIDLCLRKCRETLLSNLFPSLPTLSHVGNHPPLQIQIQIQSFLPTRQKEVMSILILSKVTYNLRQDTTEQDVD